MKVLISKIQYYRCIGPYLNKDIYHWLFALKLHKLISVKTGRFFTTPKKDVSKTDEFLTYKNSLMFVISNTNKVGFLFVVVL